MKKVLAGIALSIMAVTVGLVSVKADGGNPWEPQPPTYCYIYVDPSGQTYEVCPTPTPTPTPCTWMDPHMCPDN
jgi:hypothetical protein